MLVAAILVSAPSAAQTGQFDAEQLAEIERREAFQTQFADIVGELNKGSFRALTNAIDREQMLEAIFGLRLIDRRIRDQFEDRFADEIADIVEQGFRSAGEDFKAHLLEVESSGDQGRARVRYDLPDFQFNYHEYTLQLDSRGRLRIVDWVDFLSGGSFAEMVGQMLVAAAPSKSAVRKLLDLQRPSEQQIFQTTEMLKAARDRQRDRFLEIHQSMGPELKAQRITVMTYARLMQTLRSRRGMRGALLEMARYFPNEPLYSLMLLDLYFPTRQFEAALDALLRLESRLAVQDSAMQARLSSATLVLGRPDDALEYAQLSTQLEPGLELGWWSLLRAAAASENFGVAVSALEKLTGEFGHTLNAEVLGKDPGLRSLVSSAEFQAWSVQNPE
jgi:hypothetical protein